MLQSSIREKIKQVVQLNFLASNNEVENKAILVRLDLALALTTTKV